MDYSQIIYQIELLFPLKLESDRESNNESEYAVLSKLEYNPCLSIGDIIHIPKWELGSFDGWIYSEKPYSFEAKVVGIKRDIYIQEKVFLVRYIVEAPHRELIVEMCERIRTNNLSDMQRDTILGQVK